MAMIGIKIATIGYFVRVGISVGLLPVLISGAF